MDSRLTAYHIAVDMTFIMVAAKTIQDKELATVFFILPMSVVPT